MFTITAGGQQITAGQTEATYAGSADIEVFLPEDQAKDTVITISTTGTGSIYLCDSHGHRLLNIPSIAVVQVIATGDEFDPWRTEAESNAEVLASAFNGTLAAPLTLTPAASKIIPGATSFAIRNHADDADNLIITDAGNATLRGNLRINGTAAFNVAPSAAIGLWFGGVSLSGAGTPNLTMLVVDGLMAGTNINQGAAATFAANFSATGTISTAAGVVIGQPYNGGSATFTKDLGLQVYHPNGVCSTYYAIELAAVGGGTVSNTAIRLVAMTGTTATNYGISLEGVSGGTVNNYGILIGAVTGTGAFAIKTGTGVVSFGDLLLTIASATGTAGFRLPHGAAPSSPVDGDMWTTTTTLNVQINGTTKTVAFV